MPTTTFIGLCLITCFLIAIYRIGAISPNEKTDKRDTSWICKSTSPTRAMQKLVRRYLTRIRVYRRTGFWIGLGISMLSGLNKGSVKIGIGHTEPISEIIFGAIAGILIGSLLAETWRLTPTSTKRSANITDQTNSPEHSRIKFISLTVLAISTLIAIVDQQFWIVALAIVSASLTGLHFMIQRSIKDRGRPALPADLLEADNMVRKYGNERLERELLAGVTLFLAWQLSFSTIISNEFINLVLTLIVFVFSLRLIWQSRPWPPKSWASTSISSQAQ